MWRLGLASCSIIASGGALLGAQSPPSPLLKDNGSLAQAAESNRPSTPVAPPAVQPTAATGPVATDSATDLASPQVVAWLKQLVRDNLPETYEDTRKWDLQKEVWDGVDISVDGLNIETKRKRKLVNHGTWSRYRLSLVDPDKHLHIQFHRLDIVDDSHIAFDVSVEMLLDVFGRMSQWVRDVQMVSLSANADAVCKLSIQGRVGFRLNPLKFPPDILIQPQIDTARVDVSHFRVRRISQLGGPMAEQLGRGLYQILEGKLEESNERLPEKINRQIAKHSDRMLFSTQDWLTSKLPLPPQP